MNPRPPPDNSLALNGSGQPHISYYDANNLDLKHAWRDGTGWQIETVDSEGQVGLHTSLDVDAAGYPHISYFKCGDDCNSGELKYAWQDASGWYSETVDTGGATLSVRGFTSLALDGDGHAHISYLSYSNPPGSFDLKYAWRDGGGWYTEIVIKGIHESTPSLALDSSGYPHIAYIGDDYHAKVAWKDAGGWHFELADISVVYGRPSQALDGSGNSHISYYSSDAPRGLRYTYHDTGGWHTEIVYGNRIGSASSLALDASGYPHIIFGAFMTYYLTYTYQDAGGWHTEVANSGESGEDPSLALDGSGYPHISYHGRDDYHNEGLRYAVGDRPDLSQSAKTVSPLHPTPGERVTYTLALANSGYGPATFTLTDPLPLHATYVPGSAWANGGTITAANGITWTGLISPGFHLTATFAVTVDAAITLPTAVVNSAVLSGDPDWARGL